MVQSFKKKFTIVASAVLGLSLTLTLVNSSSFNPVKADEYHYTILDSGMFTQDVTIGGKVYTFDCYRIDGYSTYVAIALVGLPNNPPATISLKDVVITSSKPTGSNVDYTIAAIARGGFARYDFTSIELPQTVKDIREEAFAYCQKLETFQFPKDVKIVAPSAFIDCRSLTSIYYSNEDGKKTLSNSTITTFGEHCFDSCVSLRRIQCPSSAVLFERSCFQKCSKLSTFRFPYDNEETGDDQNVITVKEYAFADCSILQRVYFDVNLKYIKTYAFADSKEDLTFYFYGTEQQLTQLKTTFSNKWWNKKITTFIDNTDPLNPIDYSTDVHYNVNVNQKKPVDGGYTGMEFVLTNEAQKLNSARENTTSVYPIAAGGENYAIVDKFTTPDPEDYLDGYYEAGGILTIPDKITVKNVDYKVKVIGSYVFANNSELTEVYLNKNLVQIQDHAFFHSNNIAVLDFTECTELVEVGYSLFNDVQMKTAYQNEQSNAYDGDNGIIDKDKTIASDNLNSAMTCINLPNCLQYIGPFAFYNFTNLIDEDSITFQTNKNQPSNLKVIGDYAFAVYSDHKLKNNDYFSGKTPKTILRLPYSLSDDAAVSANYFHSFTYDNPSPKTVNQSIYNRVAVNKNAFENQDSIVSVIMQSGGTAHDISFGSNIFVRCNNIVRFEASENLCLMGHEMFKICNKLKEVFLYADRAYTNTHASYTSGEYEGTPSGLKIDQPWGVVDGSNGYKRDVFYKDSGTYPDLAIYVKSSNNTGKYPNASSTWFSTTATYSNDMAGVSYSVSPIRYIDWTATGNIKYWHIKDGDGGDNPAKNELVDFGSGPISLADYNDGYVTLCKTATNPDKYTVIKYHTDGTNYHYAKTIDMTSSPVSGLNIAAIGPTAFGSMENKTLGYYFVLQSNTTSIGNRAFMRRSADKGVRIVTFKKGDDPQVYSGCGSDFDTITSSWSNGSGYCCLPTSITQVEPSVFYNNVFAHIELPKGIVYVHSSAFYTHVSGDNLKGEILSYALTDYDDSTSPDTSANVGIINNDYYYIKGSSSNKMLLAARTGVSGTLTVDSNTKAVYYDAAAGSKFSEVDFNGAYAVYGHAFKNCYNLTTLTGASSVKYISDSPYSEDSISIDNGKVKKESGDAGSFENCKHLNVDFPAQFTNIRKIGLSAFNGCTDLVNFTKSKTYDYYVYKDGDSGDGTQISADDAKLTLDLGTLTQLKYLKGTAFNGCSIKYAILPNTTNGSTSIESKLYISGSPFKSDTAILCGETIHQADPNRGSGDNNPPIAQATIRNHYPDKSINYNSKYTYLYFRIHSASDIWTAAPSTRCYWTAINTGIANSVKIVMFNKKEDAAAWLNVSGNPARQLDTFMTWNGAANP